jgi:hypothetical protein
MPELDPLSLLLGEINAKVELVLKTQAEDRQASATYRTEIRRDLATLKANDGDLRNRVNNVTDEIAEMRPMVDAHQKLVLHAEGASKLTKIIWSVLTALGLGGVIAIVELFRRKGG